MQKILTDFTTTAVSGIKNKIFLQQLCTQDVLTEKTSEGLFYCAFLNNQGRVLVDSYLYYPHALTAHLIHPRCQSENLLQHLKKYAPFSQVTLSTLPTHWAAISDTNLHPLAMGHMPYRLCEEQETTDDCDDWHRLEIEHGIARVRQGHSALWTAHMLDMDKIGAVSYTKGCYLGQEITHRTAHLGKVKKGLYRDCNGRKEDALIYSAHPSPLGLYVREHTAQSGERVYPS